MTFLRHTSGKSIDTSLPTILLKQATTKLNIREILGEYLINPL